ncbi:MAG: nuclear transport factor 2 family protein [Balneolaceae bacterium]
MKVKDKVNEAKRNEMLHNIGRDYVLKALGKGNFEAIPYAENITLRAPLCPGGSAIPLAGREKLRTIWWAPLPDLIKNVKLFDTHVNRDRTQVTVEFHCEIKNPACILRIMDRFTINDEGKIIEQENFFDPRDVTSPGWNEN